MIEGFVRCEADQLARRVRADKPLQKLDLELTSGTKRTYARKLAGEIAEAHEAGSLTLVVLNQGNRAQEVALGMRRSCHFGAAARGASAFRRP